ncbi:MAG: hypothetical protein RLZZ184_1076 [Cyanobacteriota bacterium]
MKIKVKNLGTLREAEFTLGDLTIICGCNNTGKTYWIFIHLEANAFNSNQR